MGAPSPAGSALSRSPALRQLFCLPACAEHSLCKYPLLIASLLKPLKKTANVADGETMRQLETALALVEQKAAEVNQASHDAEQAAKVLELGSSWHGLVSPTRRLRYSADVSLLCPGQPTDTDPAPPMPSDATAGLAPVTLTAAGPAVVAGRVYLFSDLLVVAEPQRKNFAEKVASQVSSFAGHVIGLGGSSSGPSRKSVGGGSGAIASVDRKSRRSAVTPSAQTERWAPREHFTLTDLQLRLSSADVTARTASPPPPAPLAPVKPVWGEGTANGIPPPPPYPPPASAERNVPPPTPPPPPPLPPASCEIVRPASNTALWIRRPRTDARGVWLELEFANAVQCATFVGELRAAQSEYSVAQEASGMRAKACAARLETQRIARRDATINLRKSRDASGR